MAIGEKISQDDADKLVQEMLKQLEDEKRAKELGISPPVIPKKENVCRYICAYCKRTVSIEFEHVKVAPTLFMSGYKTRGKPCKNSCGHWYVSADYLKSLKKVVT